MGKSLEAIGEQYFFLKLNLEDMMTRCENDTEREDLNTNFVASRRSFNKAIDIVLSENSAEVKRLREGLEANTREIKESFERRKKMVKVLETITGGVELGKSLVKLGQ